MKKLKLKFKILLFIFIILLVTLSLVKISNLILKDDNNKANTPTTKTTTTKKVETHEAKLTFVGDFLFEQPYFDAIDNGEDKDLYFSLVKDYFKNDDLSIGNMEVVIGNKNLTSSGTGYNFCAPESIGKLVTTLDLEVLSTANNHAYDRGTAGIDSTIDFFKNNSDILTIGTHKNKNEREELKTLTINNIKFGFISYTLGTNIKIPEKDNYKVSLYRNPNTKLIDEEYSKTIKSEVSNLRKEVDVLIAIIHWGKEFTSSPNEEQTKLANLLNNLGVDIILGSHSHSIQPIKWIGEKHKTLVYYSMGNFVSADDDISRTGEKYDNAYQFGLLSSLKVTKENNAITIDNIKTEPIINYFDSNKRNFTLVPLSKYNETYEKNHYRYKYNFNKNFINNMYESVIDKEFR